MDFEWDEAKNAANIKKHGIAFKDAERIFGGFVISSPDERLDYGEDRIATTGMLDGVVVVIHTPRLDKQRIIFARRGNRREREAFKTAFLARLDS